MVNEPEVDRVWLDPTTANDPTVLEIRRNMSVQRDGYRLWAAGYYGSYALMFIVPAIAGVMGIAGKADVMTVSIATLVTAGIVGFSFLFRPEDWFARYHAAVQINQAARTEYVAGNKEEAQRLLRKAINLTTPPAPH